MLYKKSTYFLLLLFLVFQGIISYAQELTPPIQNYSPVLYGAASQNWDIAIDSAGIIYSANSDGLVSYDGQQWKLHSLNKGSIVRSVYSHNNRIYTGSYQEFGFWERDAKGKYQYTSLIPLLKGHVMQNEEIWSILSYKGNIYFRSFGAIYQYDHYKITPVISLVTNAMVVYNNQLLVAVGQQGMLYMEEDGSLCPLKGQEILTGQTIVDMEVNGKNLLVGTRNALYEFNGSESRLFHDKFLNALLEKYELNHLLKISETELVLATVKNGVIYYNLDTGMHQIYNRNSGLQNNTVLGMAHRNGKLWLGLDNGIDVINLNSPVDFYTNDTGELGAVYDLVNYNSQLYLASNTGVYHINDKGLNLVKDAEGHSWNLEIIDDILYSNHNTGTYKVVDDKFLPIDGRTGSFDIVKAPGKEGTVLIGSYTGISSYSLKDDKVQEIQNIGFPVKKILFETMGIIWATHPYEGIYRIGFEKDFMAVKSVDKPENINKIENRADVFMINNQIAVLNNGEWLKYNSLLDSLEIFEELKPYKHHRLLLEGENQYWFINNESHSIVYTNFKEEKFHLSFKELNQRLVKGNERLIKINDSIFYLTLNDGFGRINLKKLKRVKIKENLSVPVIYQLADARVDYDLTNLPQIPFSQASEFQVGVALPDSDANQLFYNLKGGSNLEGTVNNGIINFQNLSFGDYELRVYSVSPQEISSAVASLKFKVLPPWYFSDLMKVFYVFLFLGTIALIYYFNKRKLKKHQIALEQKFNKEREQHLNELEKQRLLDEINSKRRDLANTTMIGAKKNEVLMEIHGELSKDKDKFSNQFRLKHIMNKINRAIKDKNEWHLFETNFKELHEDFFKDLLATYPQLSNKDLKLCSYLKMNLSSKEIAPLMGISVRGVEVHRYRLRKKMHLDAKENLNNFLIKNF